MAQQTGSDSPMVAGVGEMLKANSQHIETLAKSYGTAFQKFGKVNEETFDFWAKRLKEDFEMPAKLAQCHEPGEFADTCSRFFEKMISDYQAQANRVASLMSDAVEEGLTTARDGLHDAPVDAPKPKGRTTAQS